MEKIVTETEGASKGCPANVISSNLQDIFKAAFPVLSEEEKNSPLALPWKESFCQDHVVLIIKERNCLLVSPLRFYKMCFSNQLLSGLSDIPHRWEEEEEEDRGRKSLALGIQKKNANANRPLKFPTFLIE